MAMAMSIPAGMLMAKLQINYIMYLVTCTKTTTIDNFDNLLIILIIVCPKMVRRNDKQYYMIFELEPNAARNPPERHHR